MNRFISSGAKKLKQLEALGQESYPRRYDYTHTVAQILATTRQNGGRVGRHARQRARCRKDSGDSADGQGRVAQLQQDGQRLQAYIKKDAVGEKGFEIYKLLDLGDHIGVSGYLFRTRTGELSVHVDDLTFWPRISFRFQKNARADRRRAALRQRYVDLIMNPMSARFL